VLGQVASRESPQLWQGLFERSEQCALLAPDSIDSSESSHI
jgi:hypothetical protein